jgi:hypothetical protein
MQKVTHVDLCCCKQCFEEISSYGEILFSVFREIYTHYVFKKSPFQVSRSVNGPNRSIYGLVKFLELKRFVVSTECDRKIFMVKPLGISYERKNERLIVMICFHKEEHEEKMCE